MKTTPINGNKNHLEITTEKVRAYRCYNTLICKQENGITFLDEVHWDEHRTISQFRNAFLNETKRITEKKIKEGTYQLKNLNNGRL